MALHGFSIQFQRYREFPGHVKVGMGYIKKDPQSYANNEKGKEELRWHALRSENKILIST
jgi:hypothetical protein